MSYDKYTKLQQHLKSAADAPKNTAEFLEWKTEILEALLSWGSVSLPYNRRFGPVPDGFCIWGLPSRKIIDELKQENPSISVISDSHGHRLYIK